jgi:hypothetical protein
MSVISLGSVCNGTDSPVWVWQEMARGMRDGAGVSVSIEHVFNNEMGSTKRMFLRDMHSGMPALFGDVRELRGSDAYDYKATKKSTSAVVRYKIPDFSLRIAGFPCKCVSTLNNSRGSSRSIVKKKGDTNNQCVRKYM